jgi:hypothetical protein
MGLTLYIRGQTRTSARVATHVAAQYIELVRCLNTERLNAERPNAKRRNAKFGTND